MADRTVTTTLIAKVRQYVGEMRTSKTATHGVTTELVDAAQAGDKLTAAAKGAGKATDALGDDLEEAARGARKLDNDIESLERQILELKVAMASVDDDMFGEMDKKLAGLESTLRRKLNVKKAFSDAGSEGAVELGLSLSQRIGPVMARVPLSPHLVAGVAAAAPEIVSLLGAAVSGGVALGVVGIGAIFAAQDDRVQAAGTHLGQTLAKGMRDEASVFVEPILRGIDRAEAKFNELRPVIHDMFAVGARNADTLFTGLIDGSDEVIRDLRDINAASEPVVNVLSRRLPSAAAASTDALKMLSGEAEHNAKTLDTLFAGLEITLAGTGMGLKALNAAAKFSTFGVFVDQVGSTDKAAAEATKSIQGLTGWTGKYDSAASKSAFATKSLSEQLDILAETASNAFNEETRLADAIAESTDKIYKNKDGVKSSTEQGRANRDMLSSLAQATLRTRDATVAQTKSAVDGERVMQRGYDAFVKAARGMGMSKEAADKLARSLGLIPPAKNVTVTVSTGSALYATAYLKAKIAELRSKNIVISGHVRWTSSGLHVPDGTILRHEGGMVPGPMSVNRDVVPALLTPGEGVVNRAGMKAIGGKAGLDAVNSGATRRHATTAARQTMRVESVVRVVHQTPTGRVLREELISHAQQLNVPPSELFPSR